MKLTRKEKKCKEYVIHFNGDNINTIGVVTYKTENCWNTKELKHFNNYQVNIIYPPHLENTMACYHDAQTIKVVRAKNLQDIVEKHVEYFL